MREYGKSGIGETQHKVKRTCKRENGHSTEVEPGELKDLDLD